MVNRVAVGIAVVLVLAIAAVIFLQSSSSPGSTSTPGTTSTQGSTSGSLAVMATDPPYGSGSNSKEYEHYNNVGAHKASGGQTTTQGSSSSGWVMLNASGTLQLNALVNASQTLAVANVQTNVYDSIRLYVDSATVTYNGQNYTATMNSNQVTASLATSAQVSGSATTVIVFDLRTVAVNTGSSSSPKFVVASSARAEVAPSGAVASASLQVGARTDLSASSWFQTFARSGASLQITSSAISSNSLTITAKDTGSESANITYVIVTPLSVSVAAGVTIPDSLQASAVFSTTSNGNLQSSGSILSLGSASATVLTVAPSNSKSILMSYSGSMQFGGAVLGVTAGQSYLVTIIGENVVASTTVVAT